MKSNTVYSTSRVGQINKTALAKKPKLTPWFPEGTKPARIGVYIASMSDGHFYRYWDGRNWHYGSYDLKGATLDKPKWPYPKDLRWRGLASNPAKAK